MSVSNIVFIANLICSSENDRIFTRRNDLWTTFSVNTRRAVSAKNLAARVLGTPQNNE